MKMRVCDVCKKQVDASASYRFKKRGHTWYTMDICVACFKILERLSKGLPTLEAPRCYEHHQDMVYICRGCTKDAAKILENTERRSYTR